MTITMDDIIKIAAAVGAVLGLYAIVIKPFNLLKRIDQVTTLTAYEVKLQGDMIATLFSHAISPKKIEELTLAKEEYDKQHTKIMFDSILERDNTQTK